MASSPAWETGPTYEVRTPAGGGGWRTVEAGASPRATSAASATSGMVDARSSRSPARAVALREGSSRRRSRIRPLAPARLSRAVECARRDSDVPRRCQPQQGLRDLRARRLVNECRSEDLGCALRNHRETPAAREARERLLRLRAEPILLNRPLQEFDREHRLHPAEYTHDALGSRLLCVERTFE